LVCIGDAGMSFTTSPMRIAACDKVRCGRRLLGLLHCFVGILSIPDLRAFC